MQVLTIPGHLLCGDVPTTWTEIPHPSLTEAGIACFWTQRGGSDQIAVKLLRGDKPVRNTQLVLQYDEEPFEGYDLKFKGCYQGRIHHVNLVKFQQRISTYYGLFIYINRKSQGM